MAKRFKVISIHPYLGGCDLNCPFCYTDKQPTKDTKPESFWLNLIPHMAKLTNQVALGSSGEPFMNPEFVKKFAAKCKKHGLICNVTTNGRKLSEMGGERLREVLKNITLVSISWDSYKIQAWSDNLRYFQLVEQIHALTDCTVGCNLLIDPEMDIMRGVISLFQDYMVDRVYALYPKNTPMVDVLKEKGMWFMLTAMFKHFYVDDTIRQIMTEDSYTEWKHPCHFFKDVVSINQKGEVHGCSFDTGAPFLTIDTPSDIFRLAAVSTKSSEQRFCPYIAVHKCDGCGELDTRHNLAERVILKKIFKSKSEWATYMRHSVIKQICKRCRLVDEI